MQGNTPTVTLCTYIYNDGELADGLLASVEGWTRQPDKIVLVDDASTPPLLTQNSSFIKRTHPVNPATRKRRASFV